MSDNKIGLEAGIDLSQWERGVASYTGDIGRMNDATGRFITGAGEQFANLGGIIAGAATAAAGAAITIAGVTGKAIFDWTADGVTKATDFESAFTGVIKTVEATDEELEMLRKGILDMTAELPASADSIASVAEAAGQLGIEVPNVLDFTRVMSDLGVTTNMSSEEAATSLARLANITGMSQGDFSRLGSSIVALGNNLATTEGEIVEMALRLAGAGTQVGMSEAQILALAGSLSSVGIQAEAGGSAISKVMIDMASEVANGGDKLAAFAEVAGMSSDEFAAAFRDDAATAILSFVKGLDNISESGGNVFGVLDDLGLGEIRVRDALLRASGATDIFNSALELSNTAWIENNALTKEAELRYGTTESKIQLLTNAVDRTQIAVGDKLLPVTNKLLDAFTRLWSENGERIVDLFGRLAEWAGEAVDQLIPLAEEWLPKIIDNLIALASWVIEAARTGEVWNEWLERMDPSLQTWVERLITVGEWLSNLNTKIGETVEWIAKTLSPITDWVAGFVEVEDVLIAAGLAVAAFLAPLGVAILKMAAVGTAATLAVAAIRDAWENNLGGVRDFVALVWEQIEGIVATGVEIVQTLWGGHGDTLSTFATTAWETIKGVISGALTIIQGVMDTVLAAVQGDWETVWNNISAAAATIWEGIKTTWNNALIALTQYLTDNWPIWSAKLGEWATAAWQWITETAIPTALEKLAEWGALLWEWVTDNAPTWAQRLTEWATAAWQWIVDAAGVVGEKLGEWLTALTAWLGENLPTFVTKLGEWASAAYDWIAEAATKIPETLANWYEAIKTWLDENYPSFKSKMEEWGDALVDWITDSTPSAKEYSDNWYLELSRSMGQHLTDFLTGMVQWGTGIVEWIGNAIPNMLTAIADFVDTMVVWMVDGSAAGGAGKIQGGLGRWLEMFIDWVSGPDGLITKLVPEWQKLGTSIIDAIVNIAVAIQEARDRINGAFTVAVAYIGTSIVEGIKSGIDSATGGLFTKIGEVAGGMIDAANEAIDSNSPSKEFEKIGLHALQGLEGGIVNNASLALEAAAQLIDKFMKKFDIILSKLPLVAQDSMTEFVQMFRTGMETALSLAEARALDFLRKFDIIIDQLPRIAMDTMAKFVEAMAQGYQRVITDTESFVQRLNAIFSGMAASTASSFTTAGQQAGAGFVSGLDSMLGSAQAKVAELGNLATQALSLSLQAQSPSKKFELRGEWAGEGFIIGLDKMMDAVGQKATELAQVALPTMSNVGGYDLSRIVSQPSSTIQSYATSNQLTNNFGPFHVSTPMDWAEMEFRMRRIVAEMI